MKLSVLICTIPERFTKFHQLINRLERLTINEYEVEIIHDSAPKGTKTIGGKRNDLLNKAVGEYVCFIDDDDDISDDYFIEILKAIESKPDCIGFEIACNMDGKKVNAASSSKYDWSDNVDGYRYVRSIYHKTPVKREIALKCMFPNISYAEDYWYSMALKPYLKSEIFINKPLYFYNYKYENPKTKYGI